MYNQINYDALSRQHVSNQQAALQQQQMIINMRNLQIQKLQIVYPGMVLHKESPQGQEWRVPLQLSISPQPLYVKVTVGPQFPYAKPIVQVMSRVTHKTIEPTTYCYIGTAIQSWNENSQLDVLIQTIHSEFQKQPPLPENQPIAQPTNTNRQAVQQPIQYAEKQNTRYVGEQITLQKPALMQLKQRINQMPPAELDKLLADQTALQAIYLEQPEVQALSAKTTQLFEDVKAQTKENLEEQQQLHSMMETFDEKYALSLSLQDQNNQLKQQQKQIAANVSKDKVMAALKKKLQEAEDKTKQTVQAYLNQQIDGKKMIQDYLKARTQYHSLEIQKVKIAQS